MLTRLIDERGAEVSPYKVAEVWNQMACIHWRRGDRDRALEVIREALVRYRDTVRRAELEQSLAHFERERG